jgi:hypothetical protein
VSFAATHHFRIAPARPPNLQSDCTCHSSLHTVDIIAIALSYVRTEHTATYSALTRIITRQHKILNYASHAGSFVTRLQHTIKRNICTADRVQVSLVIGPVSDYLLDVKISEISVVFVLNLTLCL